MDLIDKLPQLQSSRGISALLRNDDKPHSHALEKLAIWPVFGVRIGGIRWWHLGRPAARLAKDSILPFVQLTLLVFYFVQI